MIRLWLMTLAYCFTASIGLAEDPHDLRYFHHRGGGAEDTVATWDASLQARGIAGSRHVPLDQVQQLLAEHLGYAEGHRIKVDELDQDLDRHFPLPEHPHRPLPPVDRQ